MRILPEPTPPIEPIPSRPVIDHAEQALRDMYVSDPVMAAAVLPMWRHYDALSADERAAVIARFGPAPVQHRLRSRITPAGNVHASCACGDWRAVAPSERAAARDWARHYDNAERARR